jgi:hypothetical protein
LFKVYPYEDDNLNPGILGKSLADWVQNVLKGSQYQITEFIEEDFGYCFLVKRKPYWLWVGCCGHSTFNFPENGLSEDIANSFPLDTIEWYLWVSTEMGWISKLLCRDKRKVESLELFDFLKSKLIETEDVVFIK